MDIVERLRICAKFDPDQAEAADKIERLREALREIANDDVRHRDRPNRLCAIARAALGEENPFEERWDD